MKQFQYKSSERGVALLFALGILSVLMVLGLAFVSNALIAQKISVNNSCRSQADVLAESAINRVIASTKLYSEYALYGSYPSLNNQSLASKALKQGSLFNSDTSPTDGITTLGGLANLDSFFGTGTYNSKTFASLKMTPEWHLVTESPNTNIGNLPENRIIGRYAYAVLPYNMFPQVDFNSVHSTMVTPADGVTPKQMGYKVLVDGDNWYSTLFALPAITTDPAHPWQSYSQIFGRFNIDKPHQKLIRRYFMVNSPPMIEAYKTTDATGNHTYYHRFNLDRDWSTVTVDDLLGNSAVAYFDSSRAVTEALNDDNKALPFLSRIGDDRGTFVDPSDPGNAAKGLNYRRKQIAANLIEYCINDNSKQAISDKAGTWDLSTNVPNYTGNKQTDYIYEVGLEISMIKSQAAAYAEGGFTVTPTAPANKHDIQFALGVLPVVKLVQMYDIPPISYMFSNSLSTLSVKGNVTKCSIKVVYMDNQSTPVQQTATLSFDVVAHNIKIDTDFSVFNQTGKMEITAATETDGFNVQLPKQDFDEGGLRTTDSSPISVNTKVIADLAAVQAQRSDATSIVSVELISIDEINLTSVAATIGNMALFDSTGTLGFDYVKGDLGTLTCNTTITLAKDADPNKSFKFALGSVKGIDPRQNLNAGDWDSSTGVKVTNNFDSSRLKISEVMDVTSKGGDTYTGKCNTNSGANPYNPASSVDFTKDRETVSSPGYTSSSMISTAKFPPSGTHTMISPAELGYIHRGAKWETINLANADGDKNDTTTINVTAVATSLNTAGTTYKDGDGGILDMIKSIDYSDSTLDPKEWYYTYGKVDLNLANGTGAGVSQDSTGDYMYANWLYQAVLYSDGTAYNNKIKAMIPKLNNGTIPALNTRSEALIINFSDPANPKGFFNAWGAFTPANKEEMDTLPGYLINTAEANPVPLEFKAIIKAQAIKDLGPEDGLDITITKVINGAQDNTVKIQKGRFDGKGDEITGEVTYLVTFVRHPLTNQLYIVDKVQITE